MSPAILQFEELESLAVHTGRAGRIVVNLRDDQIREVLQREERRLDRRTPVRAVGHAGSDPGGIGDLERRRIDPRAGRWGAARSPRVRAIERVADGALAVGLRQRQREAVGEVATVVAERGRPEHGPQSDAAITLDRAHLVARPAVRNPAHFRQPVAFARKGRFVPGV